MLENSKSSSREFGWVLCFVCVGVLVCVCVCGWLCVCMHGCVYTLMYGPFCCLLVYLLSENVSSEPLLNRMACHFREGIVCKQCLQKKIIHCLFFSYKFLILNLCIKVIKRFESRFHY